MKMTLNKKQVFAIAILINLYSLMFTFAPLLSSSYPKIVYVAVCIDSEMWNTHDAYLGSSNPHPTIDVKEYARNPPSTVSQVFDSNFRNSHKDSFGNIFKITWFAEMDYLMAQGNLVYGDGTPAGVSGYTAIYDILMSNWESEIRTYGDSIEYHHHFMIYDGTWKKYNSGPDAGYPDYHLYAIDHMIIDRSFYPSAWRSGWYIMPACLSDWLEKWIPFDYTPRSDGIWYPVHPSTEMSRWQTRCVGWEVNQTHVNEAFARARDYGAAIFSFHLHDRDDMASVINLVQGYLNTADANEATYPNVSFKYVTAREAMQLALGFTDFTPPTFTVTSNGDAYTITSNEPLWGNHPYVALKYADGTYMHLEATQTGSNTWIVTPPTSSGSLEVIGVAASDLHGNPGVFSLSVKSPSATSKVETSLAVTISPSTSVNVGQALTIKGTLLGDYSPSYALKGVVFGAPIQLTTSWGLTLQATTATDGSVMFNFNAPSVEGKYQITVSFAGDVFFASSTANVTLTVSKPSTILSLLLNPSVEDDNDNNGVPDYWQYGVSSGLQASCLWVNDAHSGTKSVQITITYNPSLSQWSGASWRQSVWKVAAGKTYKLRVWYKSSVDCGVSLYALSGSTQIKSVGLTLPASISWRQSEWLYISLPAGTTYITVYGRVYNKASGWVVFDDFELVEA